jgi:hypothetical protein
MSQTNDLGMDYFLACERAGFGSESFDDPNPVVAIQDCLDYCKDRKEDSVYLGNKPSAMLWQEDIKRFRALLTRAKRIAKW